MPENPLRTILSKILRGGQEPSKFEIAYVHRGGANDKATVYASDITRIAKGSFVLGDGETQIPFHRVLYIKNIETGIMLWEKKPKGLSMES